MKLWYLLLDIAGKQKYIFRSNKLKENIGASYAVSSVFEEELLSFLNENEISSWKNDLGKLNILEEQNTSKEILYIGGGNVIMLFKERSEIDKFLKEFSKNILQKFPGIELVYGIACSEEDIDIDKSKVPEQLFINLNENKAQVSSKINPWGYGITLECKRSDLPATEIIHSPEGKEWVSNLTSSNIKYSDQAFQCYAQDYLSNGNFSFPNSFEEIGIEEGESKIAIVHIDGNKMGSRLRDKTLKELRTFSKELSKHTKNSFRETINLVTSNYATIKKQLDLKNNYLPIIPMIIGGDDVTFACESRVGLLITKWFLNKFYDKDFIDQKSLTASAGISIIKAKFPFYRGYELAESLCKRAKKEYIDGQSDDFCALDVMVMIENFAEKEEKVIKERYFDTSNGNLHFGPYKVFCEDTNRNDEKNIKFLLSGIESFKKLPKTKVKHLYNILLRSEGERSMFLKHLQYRDIKLPDITVYERYKEKLWNDAKTPYANMINLMDYYFDVPQKQ